MNNPLISIIVPVYNVEKYLSQCLDSILFQTYTNWEAILVDDGSKDNSGDICDDYSKKDNRFKVIHKENGGVSSARQTGTNIAIGEYIIHVDADDWIESDMLECMYSHAKEGYDIVVADYYTNSNETERYRPQSDVNNANELLIAMLKGDCMGSLWNKLIKRSLFSQISFPLDLFYCEDVYVITQIIINYSPSIINLHKAFYHYIQLETSITHIKNAKHIENRLLFIKKMEKLLSQYNWEYKDVLIIKKQRMYIGLLTQSMISQKDIIKMFRSLKSSDIIHRGFLEDYKRNARKFYRLFIKSMCYKYFPFILP